MRLYYKAVAENGKSIHGFMEARDPSDAALRLKSQSLFPVKIVEQKESSLKGLFSFYNKFSKKDLIFFTGQLSSMLSSGLTLMQALVILKDQMRKESVHSVLQSIIADVESGNTLSFAIEKFPKVSSPVYVSLIRAAETAGLLDKILERLSDNLEKDMALNNQIRGALLYPAIVVILMVAVGIIMMIFVVPQLNNIYSSLNISLPLATQLLVSVSLFIANFWYLCIAIIFGVVYLVRRWKNSSKGRSTIDHTVLKIPVVGGLIRDKIFTEFTRTLSLLIGSGNAIVPSLTQSGEVVGNMIYHDAVRDLSSRVEKGVMLGDAMSATPLFPVFLVQMVRVGEKTGKLDESLMRASGYFQTEFEGRVKTMTTLIEPLIMVVLGIGVGFLLVSVITPLYRLTSAF